MLAFAVAAQSGTGNLHATKNVYIYVTDFLSLSLPKYLPLGNYNFIIVVGNYFFRYVYIS